MTYHEFKNELLAFILEREEMKERVVCLADRGRLPEAVWARAAIRYIGYIDFQRKESILQEDYLLIMRSGEGIPTLLYWKTRVCYELYKNQGWQGVIPDILFRLQQDNDRKRMEGIIIRTHRYDRGNYAAEDGFCWRYGNIVLALFRVISSGEAELITMTEGREMMNSRGISKEELFHQAIWNSYVQMPPELYCRLDNGGIENCLKRICMPGMEEGDGSEKGREGEGGEEREKGREKGREGGREEGIEGGREEEGEEEREGGREGGREEGREEGREGGREEEREKEREKEREEEREKEREEVGEDEKGAYLLTTTLGKYGAAVLFYPDMLLRLQKFFGGDYYVDTTDLDKVMIYPIKDGKIAGFMKNAEGEGKEMLYRAKREQKLYRFCEARMMLVEV